MVRAELQPEFAALAPERAVAAICLEIGAPDDQSRDRLGVFAVVVRNAFDRVARDPGPPPAHITSALISYRLHRNALEIMHMITSLPSDPIDPGYR